MVDIIYRRFFYHKFFSSTFFTIFFPVATITNSHYQWCEVGDVVKEIRLYCPICDWYEENAFIARCTQHLSIILRQKWNEFPAKICVRRADLNLNLNIVYTGGERLNYYVLYVLRYLFIV